MRVRSRPAATPKKRGEPPDHSRQRALDRRGVRNDKSPRVASAHVYAEGTVCGLCRAVYARKTWRRAEERTEKVVAPVRRCPACRQVEEGRSYGRVVLRGSWLKDKEHEDQIRRRIANVAARARYTQPERRVVAVGRVRDGLEIMSTSQKLAHRLVREFEKAFGGDSSYRWSDRDGSLTATWTRD